MPASRVTSCTNGGRGEPQTLRNGEHQGRTDWKKPARRRHEAAHRCLPITSLEQRPQDSTASVQAPAPPQSLPTTATPQHLPLNPDSPSPPLSPIPLLSCTTAPFLFSVPHHPGHPQPRPLQDSCYSNQRPRPLVSSPFVFYLFHTPGSVVLSPVLPSPPLTLLTCEPLQMDPLPSSSTVLPRPCVLPFRSPPHYTRAKA